MSLMSTEKLQSIIEAALMVAGQPLSVAALQNLFNEDERPSNADIKTALAGISERHQNSGIELHEVASGYRLQAKTELSPWLAKLWEERPARYSRAFLETLAIIAYKQPITRAEIEEIRGVTVSTNIMKTLSEREWIRLIGFRDTPGKPALYGTTKTFLDHFSLPSLSSLPTLAEFKDMQTQEADLQVQLAIENSNIGPDNSEVIPEERDALITDETVDATSEAIDNEANADNESAAHHEPTAEENETVAQDEPAAEELDQAAAVAIEAKTTEQITDMNQTVVHDELQADQEMEDTDLAIA